MFSSIFSYIQDCQLSFCAQYTMIMRAWLNRLSSWSFRSAIYKWRLWIKLCHWFGPFAFARNAIDSWNRKTRKTRIDCDWVRFARCTMYITEMPLSCYLLCMWDGNFMSPLKTRNAAAIHNCIRNDLNSFSMTVSAYQLWAIRCRNLVHDLL